MATLLLLAASSIIRENLEEEIRGNKKTLRLS